MRNKSGVDERGRRCVEAAEKRGEGRRPMVRQVDGEQRVARGLMCESLIALYILYILYIIWLPRGVSLPGSTQRHTSSPNSIAMGDDKISEVSWAEGPHDSWPKEPIFQQTIPRNVEFIENLKLDKKLQPKEYHMEGTHHESKILITDVQILDSTGREPYHGSVLIEGNSSHVVSK